MDDAPTAPGRPPTPNPPDLLEHGARGQTSDRRLYMLFTAWHGAHHPSAISAQFEGADIEAVVYADAHDPTGVGVLAITENPDDLTGPIGEAIARATGELKPRPGYTMLGRTYALGYEPDLDDALVDRPRRHAHHPDCPWAVWYPLRRRGSFAQLSGEEQASILREHGQIGMSYGAHGLAHDIRLACHGLDPLDNDFVIGLVGPELVNLSKLVQQMRGTRQTALHLERLGPFFVGRRVASHGD